MKIRKQPHLQIISLIILLSPFLSSFSYCHSDTEQKDIPEETYSCVTVPKSISFCGTEIDLTRFDRHERMDRELMAFTYMHSTSLQIIKRANRYFPIVEAIFHENGIPDDFKYLMAIESNVSPTARSYAGAAGLWQFMPRTAKEFGLEVNDFVDERYHVEKATRAACKYLKQAYARFGNWETVAASYNAGQGRISREQERQYTDNAMLNNPQLFGFRLKRSDLYPPIPYRTIKVTSSISDLPRFAKSQGITYALLINMNPWLRGRSLPNHSHKEYIIRIPDEKGMHYNPLMTFPHEKKWVTD